MTLSKSRLCSLVLLASTVLVLGLVPSAVAQPANPGNRPENAGPPQDIVDQLLDRGFRQIQPSIFERELDGQLFGYETVVYGVDGHIWLLGQQEAFLETLQARYEEYPAVELLDAIIAQEQRIAETQARIEDMMQELGNTSGGSSSSGLTSVRLGAEGLLSIADGVSCTTTLTRAADAGPGSIGPYGSGSAGFSDNCSEIGTVSATATAQGKNSIGNIVTYTDTCPSKTGGNVSCSAYANVDAVTECFSSGQGDVTFGFFTYTATAFNSACRVLTASISGTTSLFVPWGSSRTGFWNVTASGGTPPYSYQWFFNNSPVGSNSSSYSRAFPHPGYGGTYFYSVKATVTDSAGQSKTTPTLSVRVDYENIIICEDPCYCLTTSPSGWTAVNIVPECPIIQ